jgi:hypothetical protein
VTGLMSEPFVDAARVAVLLCIRPRRVLEMARAGHLPAYALGSGSRRTWRFRLSEVAAEISKRQCPPPRVRP